MTNCLLHMNSVLLSHNVLVRGVISQTNFYSVYQEKPSSHDDLTNIPDVYETLIQSTNHVATIPGLLYQ